MTADALEQDIQARLLVARQVPPKDWLDDKRIRLMDLIEQDLPLFFEAFVRAGGVERTPSRHEHEQGAPLTDECDTWCRDKFEKWQAARGAVEPPACCKEPKWESILRCARCGAMRDPK